MRVAGIRQLTDGCIPGTRATRLRDFQHIGGWIGVFSLPFLSRFFVGRHGLGSGRNLQERQERVWEGKVPNPGGWCNYGLDKRIPGLLRKITTAPVWCDTGGEFVGVNHKVSTVCEQLERGQGSTQWSSSAEQLQGACDEGQLDRALDVLSRMDQQGSVPSVPMYRSLLKACARRKALVHAKRVHAHLAQHGLESALSLGEYVVSTLVNCSGLEDALQVFHRLPQRTVFSWTAVISGYVMAGLGQEALRTYHSMQEESVQPNTYTFVFLLKACGSIADLESGKRIHADAVNYRCEDDPFVSSCLVDMYGKCGSIVDAENVYNGLGQPNVVSWNAMLAANVQQGQADTALQLYEQGRDQGLSPDARTFGSTLQACGLLAEKEADPGDGKQVKAGSVGKVKAIHTEAQRKGCSSDVFLGSTLVSMYGKCGSVLDARHMFDGLPNQDVVTWNAMLTAYVQQAEPKHALQLYEQMVEEGVQRDVTTFVCMLQACGMLAQEDQSTGLHKGKEIHSDAKRAGCDVDVFVGNCLISMYGRCGSILDAQSVFHSLVQRDVVSWNALLVACTVQGRAELALQLYAQMQEEGLAPNEITFMCLLQACSSTGSLSLCKQVHEALVATGKPLSPLLATTLIHAYGACASMENAQAVFDALPQADVVSWNALIAGYAQQGNYAASLQCYQEMQVVGTKPDGVTLLSLLSVCSHVGLAVKGMEYFESMWKDHGINPGIEHYGSIIDLLVRTGDFARIEQLISSMPVQPDLAVWSCVLGACRKHGKVVLGKQAFDNAVSLEPKHSAAYLLMSSIYDRAGNGDAAKVVKDLRLQQGAWKAPGQCWVEHEQEVHAFHVGDLKHSQHHLLHGMLRNVSLEMEQGQKPRLHKQRHSEKLAMAFELLAANSSSGSQKKHRNDTAAPSPLLQVEGDDGVEAPC